jgi:hypothetical protein
MNLCQAYNAPAHAVASPPTTPYITSQPLRPSSKELPLLYLHSPPDGVQGVTGRCSNDAGSASNQQVCNGVLWPAHSTAQHGTATDEHDTAWHSTTSTVNTGAFVLSLLLLWQ